ncbi:MAG: hypothetical protein MRJ93_00335 [Nitrososphaeraceae archaeon]|nr:hypothetical protein [Nitrososphaeraceae archaeon]
MTQSSNSITNSRLCKYCNKVQIYWNNSKGTFVEVETGNKHFCQTRKSDTFHKSFVERSNTTHKSFEGKPTTQQYRPTFTTGSGKPLPQQIHTSGVKSKQPTKNSIQVLKGATELEVQKQYEKLSDIVQELGGKIHGSQSHFVNNGLELRIIVYYEVPSIGASVERDNMELVKSRFLLGLK